MAEYDLIITNGVCVTATDVAAYDIGIKDEKIVLLAPSGSLKDAKTTKLIDADGGYVMVCSPLTSSWGSQLLNLVTAWRHRLPRPSARAVYVRRGVFGRQL
jgi:hypothetical protein